MRKNIILFLLLLFAIPAVAFSEGVVKVIYFVPRDRAIQQELPAKISAQLKKVQTLYADQMESHGYGRKTFDLETDAAGDVIVHQVIGRQDDAFYHADTLNKVYQENKARFDRQVSINLFVVDVSTERIQGNCGIAWYDGGPAMVPASGTCVQGDFGVQLIAHEIGHAFDLVHDFRDNSYIMSYGAQRNKFSECAATALSVHSYFNPNVRKGVNTKATIAMLSPNTYLANAEAWTLKFEVNDPDGGHQIQMEYAVPGQAAGLAGCQSVANKLKASVEFTLPDAATQANSCNIWIRAIDRNGYITTKEFMLTAVAKPINDKPFTYITLGYVSPDALIPTNPAKEWGWNWDGWQHTWEKKPEGNIPDRPHRGFQILGNIPFIPKWDHWFYAHAEGDIKYRLVNNVHTVFDAYFYLPNPCGNVASVEMIGLADGAEVYKSGVLRTAQAQNKHITFDIPEDTKEFVLKFTTGGDGNACDHYILANAKLRLPEEETEEEIEEEPQSVSGRARLVLVWGQLKKE